MVRPSKFSEQSKKIGIILPISTLQKLDEMAVSRGGDRSLTACELIENAVITTQLTPPKPKKEMTPVERLIYETERSRGYSEGNCRAGFYVRGKKIA